MLACHAQVLCLCQLHRGAHPGQGGRHQGQGGLEVRGDGPGPVVPVDLHDGRGGGDGRHHPAGAQPVRRPDTNR